MGKVAVSMLSADFGHLENECRMVNSSCAEWFHLDIMDGVFVPNLSYGFPVIKAIARYARKPMDAHLMTVQPANHYARCKEIGIEWLTVHYEACTHLHRDIQQIHALGMKAGVAINPATPVHLLDSTLPYADMILIMSVNPGFGGQQFIGETYGKINQLTQMRRERDLSFLIQVDGGVSSENATHLYDAGADVLVAGHFVFSAPDPLEAIRSIS